MAKRRSSGSSEPDDRARIKQLEKDLKEARAALEVARKEFEKAEKQHRAEQVKFLAGQTDLEKQLEEAQAALHASEERAAKLLQGFDKDTERIRKERDDLQQQVNELSGRIDELEKLLEEEREGSGQAEELESRISELIELNREQQEQLEASRSDAETFARSAEEARLQVDEAVKEATAKLNTEKKALERKLSSLSEENASLLEQLQEEGRTLFLSPDRVSRLIDRFYADLKSNVTELDIRDSEIRLKIGFGGISDEKAGIIVPTAENIQEIREGLSEIVVRLGKSPH